jgi:hypothetical protein
MWRKIGVKLFAAMAIALIAVEFSDGARADEGGVSFWLPGLFGSLAAVPQQQPGWALMTTYYHASVSAKADVARAREITIGKFPLGLSATVNAKVDAKVDLGLPPQATRLRRRCSVVRHPSG